jgi:hypothetical protein
MSQIHDFELGRRSKILSEETKPKLSSTIWNGAKEIETSQQKSNSERKQNITHLRKAKRHIYTTQNS